MLRYLKLHNYQSLQDLSVDFTKAGTPKNLILIYGENGVGKTNFVNAFYTLEKIINTRRSIERFQKLIEDMKDKNIPDEIIADFVKHEVRDIKMIIKNVKTVGEQGNLILEYGFEINKKKGMYRIEMDDEEIVSETLKYVLNKNETNYFDINKKTVKNHDKGIKNNLFIDKNYSKEFYDLLDKYWGKHSMLSILDYELNDKKREYIESRVTSGLLEVNDYLQTLCTKVVGERSYGSIGMKHPILWNLRKGTINIKDVAQLDSSEKMLNHFFTTLYADVKEVFYKRYPKDDKIKYHLFFKKLIYGQVREIDFEQESTGTKNLLNIIHYLLAAFEGAVVIMDELDAGIHDALIEDLVNNLVGKMKGQLIATTHNTMLIESDEIGTESIYVFDVNTDGVKQLFPITKYERIQGNHNPRKRYLSGMYGGVPSIGELNFEDLVNELESE